MAKPKASAAAKPGRLKSRPPGAEPEKRVAATPPASTEQHAPALPGESNAASVAVPLFGGKTSDGAGYGAGGKGGAGGGRDGAGDSGASTGDGDGGGYSGAGFRSGDLPHYPGDAKRAGREGRVVLRILVGVDGNAVSVAVRESSGHKDFDDAARQAVKKWRFSPAKRGGLPISSFHDVRVRFRLDEAG